MEMFLLTSKPRTMCYRTTFRCSSLFYSCFRTALSGRASLLTIKTIMRRDSTSWQDSIERTLVKTQAPLLGTKALGSLAMALVTSSKEQSIYTGYLSELNHFFNFCRIESITPLDVTAAQIVRYIAYLGSVNTIAAGSMQPYLSAINRYLQDHQRQPVAMGPMVVDAQAGLAGLQVPLVEPTHPCRRLWPSKFMIWLGSLYLRKHSQSRRPNGLSETPWPLL